ncbi:MAG: MarC family protein [Pseudomonadota bacterium]|nr:MarC family protein [Pseudomonadota bacterium]
MDQAEFAVNFFVALFALIDPVGNVPLFATATQGASPPARRLTAIYIALFAVAFLSFFFLTGLGVLRFFGISMSAFRIAGGILLLLMGLDMARGQSGHVFAAAGSGADTLSTRASAALRFEGLVVPFGMPLLIGPGAISSAVIYAEEAHRLGAGAMAVGLGVIAAEGVLIVAAFWMTSLISRALGKVGMIIVVRVLGLILCAMAVQFMLAGVAGSTIDLIRHETAAPYQVARPSQPPAGHQGHAPFGR